MDDLPVFRYHPSPVDTGSIRVSDGECVSCSRVRGYIYVGPVYAVTELDEQLCPWCIADGTAAERFDAEFTDVGWGVPDEVSPATTVEVAQRTPGFSGWQQEHWLYHCADAAAYLGRAGYADIERFSDALEMLRHENDAFGWTPERSAEYVRSLNADGAATAYLFQCLHCGTHLAYSDMA